MRADLMRFTRSSERAQQRADRAPSAPHADEDSLISRPRSALASVVQSRSAPPQFGAIHASSMPRAIALGTRERGGQHRRCSVRGVLRMPMKQGVFDARGLRSNSCERDSASPRRSRRDRGDRSCRRPSRSCSDARARHGDGARSRARRAARSVRASTFDEGARCATTRVTNHARVSRSLVALSRVSWLVSARPKIARRIAPSSRRPRDEKKFFFRRVARRDSRRAGARLRPSARLCESPRDHSARSTRGLRARWHDAASRRDARGHADRTRMDRGCTRARSRRATRLDRDSSTATANRRGCPWPESDGNRACRRRVLKLI